LEDDRKKRYWKIPGNFSLKDIKKEQLLILLLTGILLLVIALPAQRKDSGNTGGFLSDEKNTGEQAEDTVSGDVDTYLRRLEDRLEDTLFEISGVGDVTVMITLKSSAEKVVEKDIEKTDEAVTESDSQGGLRTTKDNSRGETTIYRDGNTSKEPYVKKEISPEVEGVVVIAAGGDDPVVKQDITEAVQALFGIDTHKIRIMKKSSK